MIMNSILGVPACRRSGYSPFRCRSIPTGRASHAATIPNARDCHSDSRHLTVSLKRNKSAVTLFDTVVWYNRTDSGKNGELNGKNNR